MNRYEGLFLFLLSAIQSEEKELFGLCSNGAHTETYNTAGPPLLL